MKAIQLTISIPRYVVTKAIGALYRPAFWGPQSMLQYREVPKPSLPGPQWVRVETRYSGICGTDLHTICLQDSPALSAFVSSPFTLGHENVGTISDVGPEVEGFSPGDRVVVEPLLACAARGIKEPCEFCQRGDFSQCQNFTKGPLAAGFSIGHCRDTGGGWSPFFVAHQSQLILVPHGISDENAVMVEPFCVALHAVTRNLPSDGDTVLVLGSGVIGLCVMAALQAMGTGARVIAVAKYPFQGEMARRYGADEVVYLGQSDYFPALCQILGGKWRQPILGKPIPMGGADVVYECVGSARSIDDSLRLARNGGTVALVGLATFPRGVEWTPIWLKELAVRGSVWCGIETVQGQRVRAFQLALQWMEEGKLNLAPMVTHRFKLDDYKGALAITTHKGRHQVIKSVFFF